jgi:hypothetical protein
MWRANHTSCGCTPFVVRAPTASTTTVIAAGWRWAFTLDAFGVGAGVPLGMPKSGAGEEAVGTSGVHGAKVGPPSIDE